MISLRVKHPDTNEWMNKEELALIFEAMTKKINSKTPILNFEDGSGGILEKICYCGQPV